MVFLLLFLSGTPLRNNYTLFLGWNSLQKNIELLGQNSIAWYQTAASMVLFFFFFEWHSFVKYIILFSGRNILQKILHLKRSIGETHLQNTL